MNYRTLLTQLALGSGLLLAAGCSKQEPPPSPPKEAETPTAPASAAKTAQAVPMPAAVITNASVSSLVQSNVAAPSPIVVSTDIVALPPKKVAMTNPPVSATPKESAAPSGTGAKAGLADLTQDQMVQGLKDALGKGIQAAIANLGRENGFLTNLNVKIPMPDTLQKVETTMRAIKQDKLADDFVTTMNRAAEQAVPEAGSVFADAVKQMTIEDGKAMLTGPSDAATQYFQKSTQTNLYTKFLPIVKKATEQTGVTQAYKALMAKANLGSASGLGSLGSLTSSLMGKDSLDIDAYVTNKSLEGLYKMVADEEKKIRANPAAQSTDLLQKVFGAIKK